MKQKSRAENPLRWFLTRYLERLSSPEYERALSAFDRGISDRVRSKWRRYSPSVKALYNSVVSLIRVRPLEDSSSLEGIPVDRGLDEISSQTILERFISLINGLAFSALYVLVDKIDETEATSGSAENAKALVAPMLSSIRFLEMNGLAMKFFLWADIRDRFGQELRTDRVPMKNIEWSDNEIERMIRLRCAAYRDSNDDSIEAIFEPDLQGEAMELMLHLAHASPRDAVRLLEYMVSEQSAVAQADNIEIGRRALETACTNFSKDRVGELYGDYEDRIRRVGSTEFTIKDVAGVFKVSNQMARNYIRSWQDGGAIEQIESISVPGSRRPLNQYRVRDPRLRHLIEGGGLRGLMEDRAAMCAVE